MNAFLTLVIIFVTFAVAKPIPFKNCEDRKDQPHAVKLEVFPEIIRRGTHYTAKITFNNTWVYETGGTSITIARYHGIPVGTYRSELCDIVEGGCPIRGPAIGSATTPPYQIPGHAPVATYNCDTKCSIGSLLKDPIAAIDTKEIGEKPKYKDIDTNNAAYTFKDKINNTHEMRGYSLTSIGIMM
eukprot:gene1288-11373_t